MLYEDLVGADKIIETIADFEGMKVEEARLTYERRKRLPDSSFCGPNRTYPAHDAAHVRNAFARLAQFGHRLKPATRQRIHGCLTRRAKRHGIEHKGCVICKPKKKVGEALQWLQTQYTK
jgi:hypothetical protein